MEQCRHLSILIMFTQDNTLFQEMYSINQDPYQLTNIAHLLKNETIQHYLVTYLFSFHLMNFFISENYGDTAEMQGGGVQ